MIRTPHRPAPRRQAASADERSVGSPPHDDGHGGPKCANLCGITDATTFDTAAGQPRAATFDDRASDSTEAPWALAVLAGAIPLATVVVLDPSGWFPFSVAKWWAVVVLTLASAAVMLTSPPSASRAGHAERVGGALFAALLALTVASAIWGLDGIYAWVGTPVRHLGAAAWLLFGVIFLVGRRVGIGPHGVATLVNGVVIAGLALGIYCLYEAVVGAPVAFVSASTRLGGPFGSAAYLGAACCLLAPVAVGVAADPRSSTVRRSTAGLASVLLAVASIGSGSRAALFAMLATTCIVVVARRVRWRDMGTSAKRWVVVPTIALAAGLALAAATGAFERSAGWTSRVDEWRVALRAIADHPLLGVGPEGYRLVVGRHLDAEYVARYGEAVWIDRAHSGVLDVAVASGIVTALVHLTLLGFVGWCAIRLLRRGNRIDVGLAAAVVAYALQQQLLFPIAELDPTFWLLAGVVTARAHGRTSIPASNTTTCTAPGRPVIASHSRTRRARTIARRITAALVGFLALGAAVIGLRSVAADRLALDAQGVRDVSWAIDDAARATQLAPLDIRHQLLLARAHEQERSLRGVDRALSAVDDALDIAPLDPAARFEEARLLSLRAAITGSDADRGAAEQAWDDLLTDEPWCQRCRLGAEQAARERGE